MNDNIIAYILSIICIMLLLIEFFISHKNGVINTIAFVVYSCPLYTLMTYRGAGGAAFTWWFDEGVHLSKVCTNPTPSKNAEFEFAYRETIVCAYANNDLRRRKRSPERHLFPVRAASIPCANGIYPL